jgi:hypothetical protein
VGEKISLEELLTKGSLETMRGPPLKVYNDTLDGGKKET